MTEDDDVAPTDSGAEREPGLAMDGERLKALLAKEIANADSDRATAAAKNAKALDLYQGDFEEHVPSTKGRSAVVDTTLSDNVGWMLPQLMRLFTSSKRMVQCTPVGSEDDQMARDATLHLNHVFMKENPGYWNIQTAAFDSLMTGNGVVKVFYDPTPEYEVHFFTGLTEEAYAQLVTGAVDDIEQAPDDETGEKDDRIEILNKTEYPGEVMVVGDDGVTMEPQPATMYDCKIRRVKRSGRNKVIVIPPEDYLKNRSAKTCKEAIFQAHRETRTRSDLIKMGFDYDKVMDLAKDSEGENAQERDARDDADTEIEDDSTTSINLYECYYRVDIDGDGIAEMVRAFYAGDAGGGTLLDWEEWEDDAPFHDIPCKKMAHKWEARSLADDSIPTVLVKTALTRGMMDNMYMINQPKRLVKGQILNPDALFSNSFGATIFGEANATIESIPVEFIGDKLMGGLEKFERDNQRRTGLSQQGMALDTDALQKQTATASQMEHDAGFTQVEIIARNMAEGWTEVFRALLKLEIKHRDAPLSLRLHGRPIEIDPRSWHADLDLTVNTGLGTGSRERDVQMLQMVLQSQFMMAEKMAAAGMTDKALEILPYVSTAMQNLVESTGLQHPEHYFPIIGKEDVAKLQEELQKKAGQPSEAEKVAKIQADAQNQIEHGKATTQMQLEQIREQSKKEIEQIKAMAKAQVDAANAEAQKQIAISKNAAELAADQHLKEMEQAFRIEELRSKERIAAQANMNTLKIEMMKLGYITPDMIDEEAIANGSAAAMNLPTMMQELKQTMEALGRIQMAPTKVRVDPITGEKVGYRDLSGVVDDPTQPIPPDETIQ